MTVGEAREVKQARNTVRTREQAAWERTETAGRQARQESGAQGEKAGQRDKEGERKRQGQKA